MRSLAMEIPFPVFGRAMHVRHATEARTVVVVAAAIERVLRRGG
jgi:hypothetical protein